MYVHVLRVYPSACVCVCLVSCVLCQWCVLSVCLSCVCRVLVCERDHVRVCVGGGMCVCKCVGVCVRESERVHKRVIIATTCYASVLFVHLQYVATAARTELKILRGPAFITIVQEKHIVFKARLVLVEHVIVICGFDKW
jgi:hypothetical protein